MSKNSENETINVHVRRNQETFTVSVRTNETPQKIKEEVGRRLRNNSVLNEMVLFAGACLDDATQLGAYGLCHTSTLHIVSRKGDSKGIKTEAKREIKIETKTETKVEKTEATSLEKIEEVKKVGHACYVFCPDCFEIQPAKIRYKCKQCKSTAFVVTTHPKSIENLFDGSVVGLCHGTCSTADTPVERKCEFFFKCGRHPGNTVVGLLRNVHFNNNSKICIVCLEVMHPSLLFGEPCNHAICIPCWQQYCINSLNDRRFTYTSWYTLGCPCNSKAYVDDVHLFKVMGKEQYNKYKDIASEQMIYHSDEGFMCPFCPNGYGFLLGYHDPDNKCIRCPQCRKQFCNSCKNAWHDGNCGQPRAQASQAANAFLSQEHMSKYSQQASEQEATRKLLEETTKPCPSCKVSIEKNDGCNHMTCRCGFQFCWYCNKQWDLRTCEDHWFEQHFS